MIPVYVLDEEGVRKILAVDEHTACLVERQCSSRGVLVVVDWDAEFINNGGYES
jgi:hypothetical protein